MKPHPHFDDYLITEEGEVISTKYKKPKKITPHANNRNYLLVQLRKENKTYNKLVHRLVAETFLPNENNYKEVNHIDRNTLNNNINNLEWVTPQKNTALALAKTYQVKNIRTGEIITITNLRQWCIKNNLSDVGLYASKNPKSKATHHKGWVLLKTI